MYAPKPKPGFTRKKFYEAKGTLSVTFLREIKTSKDAKKVRETLEYAIRHLSGANMRGVKNLQVTLKVKPTWRIVKKPKKRDPWRPCVVKLNSDLWNDAVNLYLDGAKVKEIAKKLKVSTPTLFRLLNKHAAANGITASYLRDKRYGR